MDLFNENISDINDQDYSLFSQLIYKKSGIFLGDNKKELLKARLLKRMRLYRFTKFKDYYKFVVDDKTGKELVKMLDVISTNVTSFFREIQHFDFMGKSAFPDIFERKKRARRVRFWSAGCSSGEEVYSVLITLAEYMKSAKLPLNLWDFEMLGSDISTRVLNFAKSACYEESKVKGVPPLLLSEYFKKKEISGEHFFEVNDFLKRMAFFHRVNLMSDSFPFQGPFDIILCRNVMIYFDVETQMKLMDKFCRYLDDDGYLIIGHSETLLGLRSNLKSVCPAVFKKS
jgi:chemotaxis protein methyltransferase CheR